MPVAPWPEVPTDLRAWPRSAVDALRDAVAAHTPSGRFLAYASPFGAGHAFPVLLASDGAPAEGLNGTLELDVDRRLDLCWIPPLARELAPAELVRVAQELNAYALDAAFALGGPNACLEMALALLRRGWFAAPCPPHTTSRPPRSR